MPEQFEKRLDTIYRNTSVMPILAFLGIFIPIILLIAGGLGVLYQVWRGKLLKGLESGKIKINPDNIYKNNGRSNQEKIAYIKKRNLALLSPIIVFVCLVALIILLAVVIAISKK